MTKKKFKIKLIQERYWWGWHIVFLAISILGFIISIFSGLLCIILPNPDPNKEFLRVIFFGSIALFVIWVLLSLIGKIKIRLEEV